MSVRTAATLCAKIKTMGISKVLRPIEQCSIEKFKEKISQNNKQNTIKSEKLKYNDVFFMKKMTEDKSH